MSTIQELFQQAQLAEAAYANLISAVGDQTILKQALDVAHKDLYGGSFSAAQAADFVNHWRVVDQMPDTSTGFSATVFQNTDTGQYTLAIKGSTDIVDFTADAGLIAINGIAVSQVVDMYNYWQSLTHVGAYTAAKLSPQLLESTYLSTLYGINVPLYTVARASLLSNGYIVEGGTVYKLESDISTKVFNDNRMMGSGVLTGQSVTVDGHSLGGHLAMAFGRLFPDASNGGTGDDIVSGRDGNDIVIGGEGMDLLRGDAGRDELYAGSEVALEAALTAPDAPASGLKGDFIDGGSGDDVLVGDAGNDALNGGDGADIIVGGAGDDNIKGDLTTSLVTMDWSVTRTTSVDANGTTVYSMDYTNVSFTSPTVGGADVVYAGAGVDWVNGQQGDAGCWAMRATPSWWAAAKKRRFNTVHRASCTLRDQCEASVRMAV
jgi:Ca2+-binding RTX toxin-like protein